MELTKCKLGELITQRREKNDGSDLPICGVSKDGLIPPKQKDADTSIYNVFYRDDFIFNPARMELNSIAINDMYDRAICSSLYEVFHTQIGVGNRLDGGRRRVKKYLWSFFRTAPAGQVRL